MASILFLGLCFATLSLVTSAPFEEIIHGAVVPQGKYPCSEAKKMTITVGSVDKRNGQKIRVKRSTPYDHSVLPNDIAIIELEEELNFTKDIRPICLSGKQQVGDPDKNVVITGWGEIKGYGENVDLLHEGTARIVNDEKCEERVIVVVQHFYMKVTVGLKLELLATGMHSQMEVLI
ncbi:trypsin domain-containing protein [Ditylenchus destructor]|nr:trypsin domain-containing protein [Ditylenchus destructor]